MTTLRDLVTVAQDEKPFVDFESTLHNDAVVSGYVPVKSTLDALQFLEQSVSPVSPLGRAVICWGAYGSGKSRLAAVIARLFRDGFDSKPLQAVWKRLESRGEAEKLTSLRNALMPAGRAWHSWLVVPMYAQAGGGTLEARLTRSLIRAMRAAGIDDAVLGNTLYHAAATRFEEMRRNGALFAPAAQSTFSTAEQLARALIEDFDERALSEFGAYHREATHGVDFQEYLQSSGRAALHVHEVYNTVVRRIQPLGYDGIIVLWDELGFAIEELLRDAHKDLRSLGQETMALQDFVEKSCGSTDLGNRVIFMGFTHVGLSEYGTREHLDEKDQNRLVTVDARFRKPDINIRLSVAETEGYHLLAGMLRRTAKGEEVFRNPVPHLQRLADRMPKFKHWERLSAEACYTDIAASCYPIHPAAATTLLTLSDQIAQVNRTTFYYLQNKEDGGLAGVLDLRDTPGASELGSSELVRVHDLFPFFEQAIRIREKQLAEQYDESIIRCPDASPLELEVLRSVLVLTVARISPTTKMLAFCLCDSSRDEQRAEVLHKALKILSAAQSLWKNEATDVWSFIGTKGLGSDIEKELDDERSLIPETSPGRLFRNNPEVQEELQDRLGDFELDPAESGIVRRIGIKILHFAKGDAAVEPINPSCENAALPWRSALVYLVVADTAAELSYWRQKATSLENPNLYFVFPSSPVTWGTEVTDLVAVRRVLAKKEPGTHAYEVLESKLTRLRNEIRQAFEAIFGNVGLRAGTVVVKSGSAGTTIPVDSWNELLPAIGHSLESEFEHEIKVRCGKFNEWQEPGNWGAVQRIVDRILDFDSNPQYQTPPQLLSFNDTSQEAAIVDGVLVENGWLIEEPLTGKWSLAKVTNDTNSELLREVLHHFQTGGIGDKEFLKLFSKLVDPPYGVPNGIIPLILALVVRAELSRIAIYVRSGPQSQRVPSGQLAEALVGMAKRPDQYQTRYSKLSGRQRIVFKAIGPLIGVPFSDRDSTGDLFYTYCEKVRKELKQWVSQFPEGVFKLSDLTDPQRQLLRSLRLPVPPHLSLLADNLVAVISEGAETHKELSEATADTSAFPEIIGLWREFRARLDRHAEGVKAPLRNKLRDIAEVTADGSLGGTDAVVAAIKTIEQSVEGDSPLRLVVKRLDAGPTTDLVDDVAAAVAGKAPAALTEEDYGRAVGVIEMAAVIHNAHKQSSAGQAEENKAPLRNTFRDIAENASDGTAATTDAVIAAIKSIEQNVEADNPLRLVVQRLDANPDADLAEGVAAAVSGKAPDALTKEDYGRAVGVLEMAAAMHKVQKKCSVVLPSGERRSLVPVSTTEDHALILKDAQKWAREMRLTADELAFLAISAIYGCWPNAEGMHDPTGTNVASHDNDGESANSPLPSTDISSPR